MGQWERRGELLPSQSHPAPLLWHCGAAQPLGATRGGQGNRNTESHPESAGAAPHRKIQPLGYCLTSRRKGKYLLSLNASRWLWDLSGMWISQNAAPGAFRQPEVKRGGGGRGKKNPQRSAFYSSIKHLNMGSHTVPSQTSLAFQECKQSCWLFCFVFLEAGGGKKESGDQTK